MTHVQCHAAGCRWSFIELIASLIFPSVLGVLGVSQPIIDLSSTMFLPGSVCLFQSSAVEIMDFQWPAAAPEEPVAEIAS